MDDESCGVCGQPSEAKCSRCRVVNYCGPECQRLDWKSHKRVCAGKTASSSSRAAAAPSAQATDAVKAPSGIIPADRAAQAAEALRSSQGYAVASAAPAAKASVGAEAQAAAPQAATSQRGTGDISPSTTSAAAAPAAAPSAVPRPLTNSWSAMPGDAAPIDVSLTGTRSVQNAQRVIDVLKERGVCVIKAGAEKAFQRGVLIESKLLWDTNKFLEAKKGKPEVPGLDEIRFDTRDDKVVWMTKAWLTEHEKQSKALKVLDSQLTDFGWGLAKLIEEQLGLTLSSRTPGMLSCYAGDEVDGPRYDYHMDNPYQTSMGTPDDKRRLTVIYYVSDGPWDVHADGGALQVALSDPRRPPKTTAEALQHDKLTIAPDADTLVVFFSHTMYHAVLPVLSKRRRFALSTWFSTV